MERCASVCMDAVLFSESFHSSGRQPFRTILPTMSRNVKCCIGINLRLNTPSVLFGMDRRSRGTSDIAKAVQSMFHVTPEDVRNLRASGSGRRPQRRMARLQISGHYAYPAVRSDLTPAPHFCPRATATGSLH